jgi:5-carboxymethyl-2-hydroxymuconate isomerase
VAVPHITVEYSSNLDNDISPQRVVDDIHAAVLATGVFELAAIRVRTARRDVYAVADKDPANAFIAVTMRIGPGRSPEERRRGAQAVMDVLEKACAGFWTSRGVALSVDVAEIDNTATLRKNNLHQRMKDKKAKEAGQ